MDCRHSLGDGTPFRSANDDFVSYGASILLIRSLLLQEVCHHRNKAQKSVGFAGLSPANQRTVKIDEG
jgi:hypothetical protein